MKPAPFSAKSEGACPHFTGAGAIYADLGMTAGVTTTCEERRFDGSVLDYRLGGRDISEVPAMSVTVAEQFFSIGEARTPAAHAILHRLVDSGTSVIVVEHHQAVMALADWIIDLKPGVGHDGSRIVFAGTPAKIVTARSTLTGLHLAAHVGAAMG